MIRCIATAVATLAGCWYAPPAPVPAPPPAPAPPVVEKSPAIRFAAFDHDANVVRLLHVANGQVTVEREIEAPDFHDYLGTLVWIGSALYVSGYWDGGPASVELGPDGFTPIPEIPWTVDANNTGYPASYRLFTSEHARVILGHCTSQHYVVGGAECTTYQYARVWPGPLEILTAAPPEDLEPQLSALAPPRPPPCPHTVFKEPPDTIRWLVADPPIFRTEKASESGITRTIYERCAPSDRYTDVFVGPSGEIVLGGSTALAVYWHGKLLARAPLGVNEIAFAITPPGP